MKLMIFLILTISVSVNAEVFDKFVSSKSFVAECSTGPEDERGPFGLIVKEKGIEHHLLIMTGVYYDACKAFEKEINLMRKKYTHLRIIGTEGHVESSTSRVWRWISVRTVQGTNCISYFEHDCPRR